MRKRILTALLSGIVLVAMLPATSFAASAEIEEITGVVTSNGKVAVGAQVVVTCDNNTKKATTNNTGTYSVQYMATQCPNETLANVTATYRGHSSSNSGEVKNNLIIADKQNVANSVPGFSLVTGATATLLGGVGYFTMRRR